MNFSKLIIKLSLNQFCETKFFVYIPRSQRCNGQVLDREINTKAIQKVQRLDAIEITVLIECKTRFEGFLNMQPPYLIIKATSEKWGLKLRDRKLWKHAEYGKASILDERKRIRGSRHIQSAVPGNGLQGCQNSVREKYNIPTRGEQNSNAMTSGCKIRIITDRALINTVREWKYTLRH